MDINSIDNAIVRVKAKIREHDGMISYYDRQYRSQASPLMFSCLLDRVEAISTARQRLELLQYLRSFHV